MNVSYTPSQPRKIPISLLLIIVLGIGIYALTQPRIDTDQPYVYAQGTIDTDFSFSYEVVHSDFTIEWSGRGDFDPKDKCPEDFFDSGFRLICKKMTDGISVKFLQHKGKQLLYRIDKEVIREKVMIGLHWVRGTRFNAKYRIADPRYKGGRTIAVPNAKGGTDQVRFQYGEAVSKKRVRPGRELFRETHIQPKQCRSWFDLFDFTP